MRKNLLFQYTLISFVMTLTIAYILGIILVRENTRYTVLVHGDYYKSFLEEIPRNYSEIYSLFDLPVPEELPPAGSHPEEGHNEDGEAPFNHFLTDIFQFPSIISLSIYNRQNELLLTSGDDPPTDSSLREKPEEGRRSDYDYEILAESPRFIIRFHLPIFYEGGRIGYVGIVEEDDRLPALLGESRKSVLTTVMIGGFIFYVSLFLLFLRSYLNQKKTIARLDESQSLTIITMSRLAELRDDNTGAHIKRTSQYCRLLGDALRHDSRYQKYVTREYIDDLVRSAPLHDIGKVGIPDSILQKPGKLSDEEFEVIKKHPLLGASVLEEAVKSLGFQSYFELASQIVKSHHENWNGTGYPEGLEGEEIPLSARIMAFADVYDALTTKRPYKEPFSHEQALGFIKRERGRKFDPDLTDIFLALSDKVQAVSRKYGAEA